MPCYVPPAYREPVWFTWGRALGKAMIGTIAAAVLFGSIGAGVVGAALLMGRLP